MTPDELEQSVFDRRRQAVERQAISCLSTINDLMLGRMTVRPFNMGVQYSNGRGSEAYSCHGNAMLHLLKVEPAVWAQVKTTLESKGWVVELYPDPVNTEYAVLTIAEPAFHQTPPSKTPYRG